MTPQLSALEKLHGQYASLLPVAPASTLMAAAAPTSNLIFDIARNPTLGYPTQPPVPHSHVLYGAQGSYQTSQYGRVAVASASQAELAIGAPRPMSPTTRHDTVTLGPPLQSHMASTPQQQQQQQMSPMGQQSVSVVTLHAPGHVMDEPSGARLSNALARHTPPSPMMDPGGVGPQLPMLRSGSPPPPAKFRQQQQQPCAALSTQRLATNTQCGVPNWQSTEGADGNSMWNVTARVIHGGESNLHRERDDWGVPLSSRSRSSSNTARQPATTAQLSSGSSPLPGSSRRASHVASSNGVTVTNDKITNSTAPGTTISPRTQQTGATLLSTAVEDLLPSRVAFAKEDLTGRRRSRREPGSRRSSAGTGSPSPDHRVSKGHTAQARDAMPVPAEDKYLKILRSLQAKGAAGVPGGGNNAGTSNLAAQLLEGARRNRMMLTPRKSTPTKVSRILVNGSDSDSDSSSSGSSRRWSRQRRAVR